MKVWFKKCWHRIVSLFCAAVIAFTTIAYSYPVLAVAGSVAQVLDLSLLFSV